MEDEHKVTVPYEMARLEEEEEEAVDGLFFCIGNQARSDGRLVQPVRHYLQIQPRLAR